MYIEQKELFRWRRARKNKQEIAICTKLVVIGQIVLSSISFAVAGPTGEEITRGSGTVTRPDAVTTNINQASQRLDINWQTFSTARTESVNFLQPNSTALAINRVIGGKPSFLEGALNANGRVFILNESGITFFGTSQVNVGALIATTAKDVTSDDDKRFVFSGGRGTNRKVINHGTIHVSDGGFAILAAPYVQNTGTIQANLGRIELASAQNYTVDLRGDGLIDFTVTKENVDAIAEELEKLGVDNSGTLLAQSGRIGISANLASDIVQGVVNLGGVVDADAFGAGNNGGTVMVTSVGDLNVTGNVHADGGANGNGGTIRTWADGTNRVTADAVLTARGGTDGGNGGLIEVSGAKVIYRGAADASAPKGKGGTLLIDPWNITIANGAGTDGSATVYEENIEHISGIGTNVNLLAANSIKMNSLTNDGKLEGGSGNITMTVGGGACEACSITFENKDDRITTTSGKITLTAKDGTGEADGFGKIDIGHLQTTKNGGDITLAAGSGGIYTGNLSTGGTGVSNPGVIDLSTTHLGSIETGNVTIVADGAGTASASMSANAGQNLTTGTILITANDTTSPANASATLHAGENIKLKDKATIAATGAGEARAALDARAGKKLDTHAISVMANAHKAGESSAPVTADASAILIAGRDLHADGNVEVRADAENSWGDANANASLLAAAGVESAEEGSVELTFGEGSLTIDGNVDVTAEATTSFGNASANATMLAAAAVRHVEDDNEESIDEDDDQNSLRINGDVNVTAEATTSYGNASANASLLAAAGVQTLKEGNIELTFFGDGGEGSLPGNLTITGDVSVTADATSYYGNANATANAVLAAADDVDITTGPETLQVAADATSLWGNAAADATLIAAAGLESLTVSEDEGVSMVEATFDEGDLTINGNIDVTADATAYYGGGDATAAATAILAAGDDATITTGDDTVNVAATAATYGYYYDGYYSYGGSATAVSGLVAAAGLDDITVTRAEDSTPTVDLSAESGSLEITGDVTVTANATVGSYGSGDANAAAGALLAAGNDVDIETDEGTLEVGATATNLGYGDAGAGAALLVAAGIEELSVGTDGVPTDVSYDEGDLTVHGNILVEAQAVETWEEESDGGHAEANANLLAAGGMENTFVHDDITVIAKADHSEVNVGDLKTIGYDADITLRALDEEGNNSNGNNGTVNNAGNLQTTGWYADITVDAGSGGIHTGNLSTGGYGENVAHPGDIELTTTNGGDIHTGNISIIAQGIDSASAYLNANAAGDLTTGSITVTATDNTSTAYAEADLTAGGDITTNGITVAADAAKGAATAGLYAHADGDIDTGPVEVTAQVAEGWAGSGNAGADASASLTAGGNITITGNATVDAEAHSTYGNATASVALLAAAGFDSADEENGTLTFGASGSLTITGNVNVTADATAHEGKADATALALLAAADDVTITTGADTVNVAATATSGGEGDATAVAALVAAAGLDSITVNEAEGSTPTVSLTASSGRLEINGDIHVTADATVGSEGSGNALAAAGAILAAGNNVDIHTDGDTLEVRATANNYGSGEADAGAALLAAAGVRSLTVGEAGTPESVTYGDGGEGNLTIHGNTEVTAEAWEEEGEDGGHAEANANLLAAGGMDNTFVHDDIEVTASADHSEVNVGDLKTVGKYADITLRALNADGTEYGDNHGAVNAGNLQTIGKGADITVDAGSGGIHTSNLSTGGEGLGVAHPGDIELTTSNGGNIQTGSIRIVAEGTDSASAYLSAIASGNLETGSILVKATDDTSSAHATAYLTAGGDITTDDITVAADAAKGTATASLYAAAHGDIDTGPVSVTAKVDEGYGEGGDAYADASAILIAGGNITVEGDVTVDADAENSYGDATANATLIAVAGIGDESDVRMSDNGGGPLVTFGEGSLTITGDVNVTADATSSNGDANATAIAVLAAANDVTITAGSDSVNVAAKAVTEGYYEGTGDYAYGGYGGNATAVAGLVVAAGLDEIDVGFIDGGDHISSMGFGGSIGFGSGNLTINGDMNVTADATAYNGDAKAAAGAVLVAADDVTITTGNETVNVAANASTESGYGGYGGSATAIAGLVAAAGVGGISGGFSIGDAFDGGLPSVGFEGNAWFDSGNLNITGNINVTADATVGKNGNGDAFAGAGALLVAADDVNIRNNNTSVDATANNEGEGSATAAAVLLAAAGVDGAEGGGFVGGEILMDGDGVPFGGSAWFGSGNLNITGNIRVSANATVGTEASEASATAIAAGVLVAGDDVKIKGNIAVDASATNLSSSGNATALGVMAAAAGLDYIGFGSGPVLESSVADNGWSPYLDVHFGSGDLRIEGDIRVTADARADGTEWANTFAGAAALFGAANNATILTDPITVEASATNNGTGHADAGAAVIAAAGLGEGEDEVDGEPTGDLYITGDISATARASGGDYNTGMAVVDLSAPGNVTNLYGTTPPTAYAPNPNDPAHARVQAPAHLAENFFGEDFSGDGETGDFYASVNINAGGTVKVEPKPSAPICERDECEVVAALKPVEPIGPLFPGRDPLRIMADGLVVWATGAGVTAPSTGAIVTADVESAIAAGADPTTLLPATAAGGQGLSAGLDAYSIGGLDYCEQVVKGACLPALEEKGKPR